ncbi:helix-turn-helix domain-containing protein [Sulfoacidibacillus thermotolerans]|uniref:Helix-turn-helix domain-containing protein n=1 Tax=Sulfoacidibacillus thermotolerans TaxID=1765684 RepID=A0A2U3D5U1_SULT2|nr:helix-turn-helix domain-containing protein [Sulfoacidibacillus thermotolerans]PWI56671.1 hypothetical protein BM613_12645 [Sulfoacidibacillus thermotolerans]
MEKKDFPLSLTVKDVAKILGVCMPKAYDITRRIDFPVIRDGRKLMIPRDRFFQWMDESANQSK